MTVDYNDLAKKKELDERIADLNRARASILRDLQGLTVEIGDKEFLPTEEVDEKTLDQELNLAQSGQDQTVEWLRQQEVRDVLNQAREGSRYIALQRQLLADPSRLQQRNLLPLQDEQMHFQEKANEILDYLVKYFAQFEAETKVALPEAGVRFFEQLTSEIEKKLGEILTTMHDLQIAIAKEKKQLQKINHKEKRILANWRRQLESEKTEESALAQILIDDDQYQETIQEKKITAVLINSQMNEINILIDRSISVLAEKVATLNSIVGQNRVTRNALGSLRAQAEQEKTKDEILGTIQRNLEAFDIRVAQVLSMEVERRFDETRGRMKAGQFIELIDEVIDFQEYLGRIFADSLQVLQSNEEDLRQKRAEYGRLVLDFLSD